MLNNLKPWSQKGVGPNIYIFHNNKFFEEKRIFIFHRKIYLREKDLIKLNLYFDQNNI